MNFSSIEKLNEKSSFRELHAAEKVLELHKKGLTSLEGISASHSHLRKISLKNNSLVNLNGIQGLKELKTLWIEKETALVSIKEIERLPSLEFLDIRDKNLNYFVNENLKLSKLQNLTIITPSNLPNLEFLKGCLNITELYIECNTLLSIKGIEKLKNLKTLSIHGNLSSLNGVEGLLNLEVLDCSNNNLSSLEAIRNLTNLRELKCEYNKLVSLEAISNLTNLIKLSCEGNNLSSLTEIVSLRNLEELVFLAFDIKDELRSKYSHFLESRYTTGVHAKNFHGDDDLTKFMTVLMIEAHLKPGDERRGEASIMDTGLFDFKI